jgi:hypothetical protein
MPTLILGWQSGAKRSTRSSRELLSIGYGKSGRRNRTYLHIGNKQNGFAIHSHVNVIPEGKAIAAEPYETHVSLRFCENVGVN